MNISKILKLLYIIILIFGLNFNHIQADEHNSLDEEELPAIDPFQGGTGSTSGQAQTGQSEVSQSVGL